MFSLKSEGRGTYLWFPWNALDLTSATARTTPKLLGIALALTCRRHSYRGAACCLARACRLSQGMCEHLSTYGARGRWERCWKESRSFRDESQVPSVLSQANLLWLGFCLASCKWSWHWCHWFRKDLTSWQLHRILPGEWKELTAFLKFLFLISSLSPFLRSSIYFLSASLPSSAI